MNDNASELVPVSAYVPPSTRRRLRILAAKREKTMRATTDECFKAGLELMEAAQEDIENAADPERPVAHDEQFTEHREAS